MLPHQEMFESFVNFTNINGESLIKKNLYKMSKNDVLTIIDTRTMCDVPFFSFKNKFGFN